MSLIHDALKKAQKGKRAELGSGIASMEESTEMTKKGIPKRTVILAVVLVIALVIFAYLRFKPKSADTASSAPVPKAAGSVEDMDKGDVGMLKERAIEAYRSGDMGAAWSNFSTAVNLDPQDPELWNNLGLVAKKRGDASESQKDYKKALELKPEYPEALNNLAMIEMEGGNNTNAIDLLNKALTISPAYPEANFNLAFLYDRKGNKGKAVEYYKRFLEVGGGYSSNIIDAVRDHLMEIEK